MSDPIAIQPLMPTPLHRAIDLLTSVTVDFQRLQRRATVLGSAELEDELQHVGALLCTLGGLLAEVRDRDLSVANAQIATPIRATFGRSPSDGRGYGERSLPH